MKTHLTDLEQSIKGHCDDHYTRDLPSRLKKLGEEYGELAEAIANGDWPAAMEEAADMTIILTDMVALMGDSLSLQVHAKLLQVMIRERRRKRDVQASNLRTRRAACPTGEVPP